MVSQPRQARLVNFDSFTFLQCLTTYTTFSKLGEALALQEGVLLASSCLCNLVLVEFDCWEIMEACRNQLSRSEISMVVDDICKMKEWFAHCDLLWTPWESKEVVHHVAQLLLEGNLNCGWLVKYPAFGGGWKLEFIEQTKWPNKSIGRQIQALQTSTLSGQIKLKAEPYHWIILY